MKWTAIGIIWLAVVGLGIMPGQARADVGDAVEWLLEEACSRTDYADCDFNDEQGLYKLGPYSPASGGMGKIRSEAAYCLLRDADLESARAQVGPDWLGFGTNSRFRLTSTGPSATGTYRAEGQRILDLTLFGGSLPIEVHDLAAGFPVEEEGALKYRCARTVKLGKMTFCTRWIPYRRTGYYISMDTFSYNWNLDLDEIINDILLETGSGQLPPGTDIAFGQDVEYAGPPATLLAGTGANLTDGVIHDSAGNNNAWIFGKRPCPTGQCDELSEDQRTSYLDVVFPVYSTPPVSFRLGLSVGANGFFMLNESPDPDNPGSYPDIEQQGNDVQSPLGGATSTGIAAGTNFRFSAHVCLDLYFTDWCGDFDIVDAHSVAADKLQLNSISYGASGVPEHARWADGLETDNRTVIRNQIQSCLAAAPIEREPETAADDGQWADFVNDANAAFADTFIVCQVEESGDSEFPNVQFKLCDRNMTTVYEPEDGIHPETDSD